MVFMQTIRSWFSHAASSVPVVGLHRVEVHTNINANNVTTQEERNEVVARGVLIQDALRKQLGGDSGS